MWILFGPVEPITSHALPFLIKENFSGLLFPQPFVFLLPFAMLSLRDLFFWPSTLNIFSISQQVTFPRSLITLIVFALDFHQILCSLFGLCCPNLCSEVWLCPYQRYEEHKSVHTTQGLHFVLHLYHFSPRKVLNSNMNISSASFTVTLKLTEPLTL